MSVRTNVTAAPKRRKCVIQQSRPFHAFPLIKRVVMELAISPAIIEKRSGPRQPTGNSAANVGLALVRRTEPKSELGLAYADASVKVALIGDERSLRKTLGRICKFARLQFVCFASPSRFLDDPSCHDVDCLMCEVRVPGIDGLTLQAELKGVLPHLSVVFVADHADISLCVNAMKAGAVDFLERPVDEKVLLGAIRRGAECSRALKRAYKELAELQRRQALLTNREHEIFTLVVAGLLNKQIASELSISEKTVKVHRARVMEKMEAPSLADLVRMALRIGICGAYPGVSPYDGTRIFRLLSKLTNWFPETSRIEKAPCMLAPEHSDGIPEL